jgi:hypothetical protein
MLEEDNKKDLADLVNNPNFIKEILGISAQTN